MNTHILGYLIVGLLSFWHIRTIQTSVSQWLNIYLLMCISSILGARVGHILLYEPLAYKYIFNISQGGMSFFGSFITTAIVLYFYSVYHRLNFLKISDFLLRFAPIGIMFGRVGNFLNNELWGHDRWGILPSIHILVHNQIIRKAPTQLLEAFFEGVVIFIILLTPSTHTGRNTYLFMIFYGLFRGIIELFKYPQSSYLNDQYILGYLTLSGILSWTMFAVGIYMWQKIRPKL